MGIDIEKIKQKIEEEKRAAAARGRSFDKLRFWKPKVGENLIRLMPPWTSEGPNADVFYRETYRHWKVGPGGVDEKDGLNFTCPVKTPDGPGGPCEVCDFVAELRQSKTPADLETAKMLSAKKRITSNVVDLNDPVFTEEDMDEWKTSHAENDDCPFEVGHTKVQLWSYGTTLFSELLTYFVDSIPLADFKGGHNIKLSRTGKGKEDTRYHLRPDLKPSDFEFIGDFEKLAYNLDSLSPFPEPGAMKAALEGSTVSTPTLPPTTSPLGESEDDADSSIEVTDAVKELEEKMKQAAK